MTTVIARLHNVNSVRRMRTVGTYVWLHGLRRFRGVCCGHERGMEFVSSHSEHSDTSHSQSCHSIETVIYYVVDLLLINTNYVVVETETGRYPRVCT